MTTCDETTCDEIETYRHASHAALSLRALNLGPSNLASLTKLLLFVVMQCLTVILIGFAALFVSFEALLQQILRRVRRHREGKGKKVGRNLIWLLTY